MITKLICILKLLIDLIPILVSAWDEIQKVIHPEGGKTQLHPGVAALLGLAAGIHLFHVANQKTQPTTEEKHDTDRQQE